MKKTIILSLLFVCTTPLLAQTGLEVSGIQGIYSMSPYYPSMDRKTETGLRLGRFRFVRENWFTTTSLFYSSFLAAQMSNSENYNGSYINYKSIATVRQAGVYHERYKLSREIDFKWYSYAIYGTGLRFMEVKSENININPVGGGINNNPKSTYAAEICTSIGYGFQYNITRYLGLFAEGRGNLGYLKSSFGDDEISIRAYTNIGIRTRFN